MWRGDCFRMLDLHITPSGSSFTRITGVLLLVTICAFVSQNYDDKQCQWSVCGLFLAAWGFSRVCSTCGTPCLIAPSEDCKPWNTLPPNCLCPEPGDVSWDSQTNMLLIKPPRLIMQFLANASSITRYDAHASCVVDNRWTSHDNFISKNPLEAVQVHLIVTYCRDNQKHLGNHVLAASKHTSHSSSS